MAVEVHVDGVVVRGRFAEFLETAEAWRGYRRDNGLCRPRLLTGLSGTMNAVRFVFRYDSLAKYEGEEARVSRDAAYVKAASAMPFEGRLRFSIFKEQGEPSS